MAKRINNKALLIILFFTVVGVAFSGYYFTFQKGVDSSKKKYAFGSGFSKYSGLIDTRDGVPLSACAASSEGRCSNGRCVSTGCTTCDSDYDRATGGVIIFGGRVIGLPCCTGSQCSSNPQCWVCTPDQWDSTNCRRCNSTGSAWGAGPGSDWGGASDPGWSSAAWCSCAQKYDLSAYNANCRICTPNQWDGANCRRCDSTGFNWGAGPGSDWGGAGDSGWDISAWCSCASRFDASNYHYPNYLQCGLTCTTRNDCAADTCQGSTCFDGCDTVSGSRDCSWKEVAP